jgi:hypothetical protein
MRIRDFENCVSMTMPNFGYSFLIHRAFHSVATAPETLAKASPSATVEKQLTGVEQLRQALQILTVAARVTAVFGLHKRFSLFPCAFENPLKLVQFTSCGTFALATSRPL